MIITVPARWNATYDDGRSATGRLVSSDSIMSISKSGGYKTQLVRSFNIMHIWTELSPQQIAEDINQMLRDEMTIACNPDALGLFQRLSQLEDENALLKAELAALKPEKVK